MAKLKLVHKVLICLFCVYWFVIFPIIWFVIRPQRLVKHIGEALLFLLFLAVVYLMLHGIIVCLFKKIKMEASGPSAPLEVEKRKYFAEDGGEHNSLVTPAERQSLKTVLYCSETKEAQIQMEKNEAPEETPARRKPRPMSSFRSPYEGTTASRMLQAIQANSKYDRNITKKFIIEEKSHTNKVMAERRIPLELTPPPPSECCMSPNEGKRFKTSISLFYDGNKKFEFDQ